MDRCEIVCVLMLSLLLGISIIVCVIHLANHEPQVTTETSDIITNDDNDAGPVLLSWFALLFKPNTSDAFCGGSLITGWFVLTSAHCFKSKNSQLWNDSKVRLGGYGKSEDVECNSNDAFKCMDPVQDFMIEQVFKHPGYNSSTKMNDVALIKLDRSATIYSNIRPISIPIDDPPVDKLQGMYMAWSRGTSRINVFINTTEWVKKMQKRLKGFQLGKNHVLAGGNGTANHCSGDSGGPLMYRCGTSNHMCLYAIISQGTMTCSRNRSTGKLPDTYTKVSPYLEWILNITNIL